jgi:hypothetical protein
MASFGRVHLSHSSGRKAKPCENIAVHPHTNTPLATTTPTSLALARDRQHNNGWKLHTHTVIICWLTIGVFSISHWRKCNHEPLISLRGPRRVFLLSIKASAMLRPNSTRVIKTSLLISRPRQRQNQLRPQHPLPRQRQNQHSTPMYPPSSTRHSPAPSAFNNLHRDFFSC